jgi:folate-binding Fe-S cluster repair protein YgfZ
VAEIIARLGRTTERPERLALLRPNGTVSNWFAHDETREEIAAALAAAGLVLRDDDTVELATDRQQLQP